MTKRTRLPRPGIGGIPDSAKPSQIGSIEELGDRADPLRWGQRNAGELPALELLRWDLNELARFRAGDDPATPR